MMKISYDVKTDFMSVKFDLVCKKIIYDYQNGIEKVLSSEDLHLVGYNLYNARETIKVFGDIYSREKFAMLVKMYRKRSEMTQTDLHKLTTLSLPTIKKIESGEIETGIDSLAKVKKVLWEIDLNLVATSKF